MTEKRLYTDVGELGWSLYLSAHLRWVKRKHEQKNEAINIGVMTYPDRMCLYEDIADSVFPVPKGFKDRFKSKIRNQSGLTLKGVSNELIRKYLQENTTNGFQVYNGKLPGRRNFYKKKTVYEPFPYKKKMTGKRDIIIFPRHREEYPWNQRNLPGQFYVKLIKSLCNRFPDLTIRTVGVVPGAYDINIDKDNYINDIKKRPSLQGLIDRCQIAIAAVGSQSAPPKLSLLQGVPTFMIGHQALRHTSLDNWMSTKVGFYPIDKRQYRNFDFDGCVEQIGAFVEGCK